MPLLLRSMCNKKLSKSVSWCYYSGCQEWSYMYCTWTYLKFVGCSLMSHSAIFQLYSDGTVVQFPNLYLLPGTQCHGQLGVFGVPSLPRHGHPDVRRRLLPPSHQRAAVRVCQDSNLDRLIHSPACYLYATAAGPTFREWSPNSDNHTKYPHLQWLIKHGTITTRPQLWKLQNTLMEAWKPVLQPVATQNSMSHIVKFILIHNPVLGGHFLPLGTDMYPTFARLGKCCLTLRCLTLRV